ncbi:hypothetical protein [Algibacter sp. L4_22]|uniref:hypothetical protein n=1 Tax=Algibacter sp. L4_22 TaxID=2942477 RepID=UPI00201B7ED5|nr:hypothetical protein [Algibacter sp. L4_22]MCL5129524.1 hypothetical protein [Algibacter sp. L4_22]
MKKSLKLFTSFLVVFLFISCSSKDDNENTDLLGVWQTNEVLAEKTTTFTLVFGENNTGLSIYAVVNNTGEETSSLEPFSWELNGKVVTLLDIDTTDNNYEINDDGQLVLNGSGEVIILEKISNNYSQYY